MFCVKDCGLSVNTTTDPAGTLLMEVFLFHSSTFYLIQKHDENREEICVLQGKDQHVLMTHPLCKTTGHDVGFAQHRYYLYTTKT